MKFQDDPSVHGDRFKELMRAMHQRYIDLALLVASGLLLAFAIGYVVGQMTRH